MRLRSRPFFAAILGVFAIVEQLLIRGKLLLHLLARPSVGLGNGACFTCLLLLLLLLGES
jgi:hypothetical protein